MLFISSWGLSQHEEYLSQVTHKSKREIGYYNVFDTSEGSQNDVIYYEEDSRIVNKADYKAWSLHFRLRLRYDFRDQMSGFSLSHHNISRELLYASKNFDDSSLIIGLQELTWGESLIFPIMDIVNPRNVHYPKGFLDSDSKISVPMINFEIYSAWGNLQLLYIPIIRATELPEEIGDYSVERQKSPELLDDQEFGLRYKFPFDSLDLRLYALRHRNREPSFRFKPFSDGTDLKISHNELTTIGLSGSMGTLTRVWKLDTRHTPDQVLSGIVRRTVIRNLTQTMIGMDQAMGIDHTLGFELHFDNWGLMPEAYNDSAFAQPKDIDGNLIWMGVNLRFNLFNQKLKPQIIHFQGINNQDRFSRIKVTSELADRLQLTIEYQDAEVDSSSPKFILSKAKRILTEIKIYL